MRRILHGTLLASACVVLFPCFTHGQTVTANGSMMRDVTLGNNWTGVTISSEYDLAVLLGADPDEIGTGAENKAKVARENRDDKLHVDAMVSYHNRQKESELGLLGGVGIDFGSAELPNQITPFARILIGTERFREGDFSMWNLAIQPGGGVSIPINDRVDFRVGADLRFVKAETRTFKELLVNFGVGFDLK